MVVYIYSHQNCLRAPNNTSLPVSSSAVNKLVDGYLISLCATSVYYFVATEESTATTPHHTKYCLTATIIKTRLQTKNLAGKNLLSCY
mmetsp:Transcript_18968/g.28681  ORF Transcript_18968/g.28681 Transcript_18968/m.28681 type:complete len:88 (-) Transcript_18968:131-394(-)